MVATRQAQRIGSGDRRLEGGFTLVEILIVVIILGILAALVVPKFSNASTDSKAAAAAATCRVVQQKILEYRGTNGSYPATIDPAWFAGGNLPKSPFNPLYADPIEVDTTSTADIRHPRIKSISTSLKPFWYNASNGLFRARVTLQSSTAKTLELYNKANNSALTSYFQQTD